MHVARHECKPYAKAYLVLLVVEHRSEVAAVALVATWPL
jgi:hypothetical protein